MTATATTRRAILEAPASPGQERLWFLDQLAPAAAAYHVAWAVRLAGPLDLANGGARQRGCTSDLFGFPTIGAPITPIITKLVRRGNGAIENKPQHADVALP